jgi:preprotein translocase subunit YajC
MNSILLTLAMASSAPAADGAPAAPSIMDMVLPIGLMFLIVYFLILRPQQKKAEDQKKLVTNLKKGDYVVTLSGIYGRVIEVDSKKAVTVEVASNVRIKIRPDAIAGIDRPEEDVK